MTDFHSYDALFQAQCARYPKLTVQDLVKALYQSEFGCGHFVTDRARGLQWLLDEEHSLAAAERESELPFVEPLGDAYVRAHLSGIKKEGLAPETLFALFVSSAQAPAGDMTRFSEALNHLEMMIENHALPLEQAEDAQRFLNEYRRAGCPPTHHSEQFRAAYAPAYRVIRADLARFLPVFCAVDRLAREKERVVVAIEGGSASGKSTLGALLKTVYDANLFHMDDFFLQPHQRTAERLSEVGGNVDYERFRAEVIEPLLAGLPFEYRTFDCSRMTLGQTINVTARKINIVEGAYSMHPTLETAYDLSVFLEIEPTEQAERILARNGADMQRRFLNEWIPLENRYFDITRAKERCTLPL